LEALDLLFAVIADDAVGVGPPSGREWDIQLSRHEIISHSPNSAALARNCWLSTPRRLGRSEWSSAPERQRTRQ
jgi:hypothetical protein